MMKYIKNHWLLALSMAAPLVFAGCSLNDPNEFGDKCMDISYIWTSDKMVDVLDQNPDYLIYFDHDICPQEAPFCITLLPDRIADQIYPEIHFCSDKREACPKDSHLYYNDCERDTANHCGSQRQNCLDRSKGVATAECVDINNDKECLAKSCMQTYALHNGACITGDQCCGPYCHDCFRAVPQQVCYTYENKTQCGDGCPAIAPQTCNGVCIDPMNSVEFCGTQDCELHYCPDEVEGWRNGQCIVGQCQPSDCLFGYHLAIDFRGQKYCTPDTPYACGDSHLNCSTDIDNALETECIYGQCIVKKCRPGYLAYDDKCIVDNDKRCGTQVCGAYQHCNTKAMTCECEPGYTNCNGTCYDLKSNVFHCGSCSNECRMAHADTSCENSKCVYDCNNGYTFNPVTETCEPVKTPVKTCDDDKYDCNGDASLCCDCAGACDIHACDNSVCDPIVECSENTGCATSCCIENICVANSQCGDPCPPDFHKEGKDCVADDIANCGAPNHACAVKNAQNLCI